MGRFARVTRDSGGSGGRTRTCNTQLQRLARRVQPVRRSPLTSVESQDQSTPVVSSPAGALRFVTWISTWKRSPQLIDSTQPSRCRTSRHRADAGAGEAAAGTGGGLPTSASRTGQPVNHQVRRVPISAAWCPLEPMSPIGHWQDVGRPSGARPAPRLVGPCSGLVGPTRGWTFSSCRGERRCCPAHGCSHLMTTPLHTSPTDDRRPATGGRPYTELTSRSCSMRSCAVSQDTSPSSTGVMLRSLASSSWL